MPTLSLLATLLAFLALPLLLARRVCGSIQSGNKDPDETEKAMKQQLAAQEDDQRIKSTSVPDESHNEQEACSNASNQHNLEQCSRSIAGDGIGVYQNCRRNAGVMGACADAPASPVHARHLDVSMGSSSSCGFVIPYSASSSTFTSIPCSSSATSSAQALPTYHVQTHGTSRSQAGSHQISVLNSTHTRSGVVGGSLRAKQLSIDSSTMPAAPFILCNTNTTVNTTCVGHTTTTCGDVAHATAVGVSGTGGSGAPELAAFRSGSGSGVCGEMEPLPALPASLSYTGRTHFQVGHIFFGLMTYWWRVTSRATQLLCARWNVRPSNLLLTQHAPLHRPVLLVDPRIHRPSGSVNGNKQASVHAIASALLTSKVRPTLSWLACCVCMQTLHLKSSIDLASDFFPLTLSSAGGQYQGARTHRHA